MPDTPEPTHPRHGFREVPMYGGVLDGQTRTVRLPVEDRTPYVHLPTRQRWLYDAAAQCFRFDGVETDSVAETDSAPGA